MNDGFVPVGDVGQLLAEAQELLAGIEPSLGDTIGHVEVRNWLKSCDNLVDRLDGNRKALYSRVFEALGTASICWDPKPTGVFQQKEAIQVGDELMSYIQSYADSLPLIRPADTITREEDDPVERLAAGIYEISTRVGTGLVEEWSEAPLEIKRTLRITASELLRVGLVETAELSVEQRERLAGEMAQTASFADDYELVNALRATSPNMHPDAYMRPHCLPGCDRLDGHDGRESGTCMRNGTVISTGLPPNIGMPPGFRKEDRDGRTDGTAGGSS